MSHPGLHELAVNELAGDRAASFYPHALELFAQYIRAEAIQ